MLGVVAVNSFIGLRMWCVFFVGVLGQKRRILWTKPGDLRVLKTEGIKRLELPRVVGMKVVGFWA